MNFSKWFGAAKAAPAAGQALSGVDADVIQKELDARGITQEQLAQFAAEVQKMVADGRISKKDMLLMLSGKMDPSKMPPALMEVAQKMLQK